MFFLTPKSNNETLTQTFAGFISEMSEIKNGLKDVTISLKEVSEQIIEHRVQTTEWRSQHEKEGIVYRELFNEIRQDIGHVKEDIQGVKIDMERVKTQQENNKELNSTKIASVDQKQNAINTTKDTLNAKQVAMFGVIATGISVLVASIPLLGK